jgi:hypothetical protein
MTDQARDTQTDANDTAGHSVRFGAVDQEPLSPEADHTDGHGV